jgi:2'-5' RNA ligase
MKIKDSTVRLFIAINFNESIKNDLCKVIEELKSATQKGSFTNKNNLHLTVVFIGEVSISEIGLIKKAMDAITCKPFTITLRDIGHFKRRGGDIYWVGVEENKNLKEIYSQLFDELIRSGFSIDKRGFKPHLTIGRRVVLKDGFDENQFSTTIPPMEMVVGSIELMKSERVGGRLIYTPIYQKKF